MLLAGLGSLFAAWAAALWRADGYAPTSRSAKIAAAGAALLLTGFEAGAAFSGGDGVDSYTSSQLFFAIMVRF